MYLLCISSTTESNKTVYSDYSMVFFMSGWPAKRCEYICLSTSKIYCVRYGLFGNNLFQKFYNFIFTYVIKKIIRVYNDNSDLRLRGLMMI